MINFKPKDNHASSADLTGLLLLLEYASEQASMLALPSTARLIEQAVWSIRPKLAVAQEQENNRPGGHEELELEDDDRALRQWQC